MNFYNPYYYAIPYATTAAPRVGLFSRLLGGRSITLGSILNGTQKALGFANQAIPVVKQATPIIKNAKTMFKVMNEFKKDGSNTNSRRNIIKSSFKKNNNINQSVKNTVDKEEQIESNNTTSGYPTFFV